MNAIRRAAGLCLLLVACGGSLSVLHRGKHTGEGAARVDVENKSGTRVEQLYVARTEAVNRARASGVQPGSSEDAAVWGDDRLDNAGLGEGQTFRDLVLPEGRYDVLVVDHDHREQLVKNLRLDSGRKYVLELGTDWAMAR